MWQEEDQQQLGGGRRGGGGGRGRGGGIKEKKRIKITCGVEGKKENMYEAYCKSETEGENGRGKG